MSELSNSSPVGRLLEEISWEGSRVRAYRSGGRGLENVLTTEVLMLLDFLPRRYLAAVMDAVHGGEGGRRLLAEEAESAELVLLPGDVRLSRAGFNVQPDATITSPSCSVLVEAKRIGRSAFQPDQLAREYAALMQETGEASPLLLLVLGAPPPVAVKGHGRLDLIDAVAQGLDSLVEEPAFKGASLPDLLSELGQRIAWITWAEIQQTVEAELGAVAGDASWLAAETRLAQALIRAVDWHS